LSGAGKLPEAMSREQMIESQARRTGARDIETAIRVWRETEQQRVLEEIKVRERHAELVKRMRAMTPRP